MRLLVRTAVATAAMAALLAALELLDDGGAPPELAPPAQAAVPAVAPTAETDPTASGHGADVTSPAGTIEPAAADAGPPLGDAPASGPAPTPSSGAADALAATSASTPVAPTAAAVSEPTPPAAPLVPPVAPPVAPSAAPSAAAVPAAEPLAPGYLVQLGVFGAPANAESLRAELAAQGYPAHIQSRVVLGPFPTAKAAKASEEKLRRELRLDGIIMAPRKP